MRLKSFRAATMAEAMQQVRDHFGDSAVIVSTQRNPTGAGVRVTAAVEEPDVGDTGHDHEAPGHEAVDTIDAISQTLDFHGLPSALADRLLGISSNLLLDDPAAALAVALDAAIGFEPLPAGTRVARPLMFVGPSGVGKTVTLAKLAVRAAFERQPVHVVTTDTLRAGGFDQLAAFTRLLKVDLLQAEDPDQLRGAVGETSLDAMVLIDTVAVNPFGETDMTELKAFVRAVDADPILVMPGGMDIAEAAEIGQAFRAIGCARMLATRIDTTRRLGSIVNTACAARLKLCDYTHSPHVTQGLDKLNPLALAHLMLPGIAAQSQTASDIAGDAYDVGSSAGADSAPVVKNDRVEPAWAHERDPQSAPISSVRTPPPRGAAGAYRSAPPSLAAARPVQTAAGSPRPPEPGGEEAAAEALAAAIVVAESGAAAAIADRPETARLETTHPAVARHGAGSGPTVGLERLLAASDVQDQRTPGWRRQITNHADDTAPPHGENDDALLLEDWVDPERNAGEFARAVYGEAVEPLEASGLIDPMAPVRTNRGSACDGLATPPSHGRAPAGLPPDEPLRQPAELEPDFDALQLEDDFEFGDDSISEDRRTSDTDAWTSGNDLLQSPAAAGSRFGKTRS